MIINRWPERPGFLDWGEAETHPAKWVIRTAAVFDAALAIQSSRQQARFSTTKDETFRAESLPIRTPEGPDGKDGTWDIRLYGRYGRTQHGLL